MPTCLAPWCGRELTKNEFHPGHDSAAKDLEAGFLYVVVTLPSTEQLVYRFPRGAAVYGDRGQER